MELLCRVACGRVSNLKVATVQRSLTRSYGSQRQLKFTPDLIAFHKSLVDIESISGNERHIGEWLALSLQSQGFNVEKQYVPGPSQQPERFNLLAWPGNERDAKVVLTSHIDTVPPLLPYERRDDGFISGRGSVDDKGSLAAQVLAVNQLVSSSRISPDDVALLFVVGEEVGGVGMQLANKLQLRPQAVIFGEPTEGKLVVGHKGIMVLNMRTKGRAAHSGYPWLGLSATDVLITATERLRLLGDHLPQSEKYGKTTLNLGLLSGGVALNVVPDSASAGLAVRIAAGTPAEIQSSMTAAVHDAVAPFLKPGMDPAEVVDLDFSSIKSYGPIDLDADVPGFEVMPVNYGSDIPWLQKTVEGQKRYLYGPGSIFVAHTDHEGLMEDELFDAVVGYEKIVLHALRAVNGDGEA